MSFWDRIREFLQKIWRFANRPIWTLLPKKLPKPKPPEDLPLPMADPSEVLPKQDQQHACGSYTKLKIRFRDIGRENAIIEILGRDFLTAMPEGAYQSRLGQIAYLFRRVHEDISSEEISQLLGEARAHEFAHPKDWDAWDRANLREMERLYREHCHVDAALMERKASLSYEGRRRHRDVLKNNDWEQAKGFLQEQIDLHRKIASARCEATGEDSHYQMLMQEFMPGMKVSDIEKWFDRLEKELKEILPAAREKQSGRADPIALNGKYPAEAQMWLNKSLLSVIGFDFDRGGLYETGHNPVEGGTPEDTRLVIKCAETDNFLDSMKSALHEGGHGLYIQGLPRKEWRYQPVAQDLGAAVHESQALLIEMVIGRMPEFFDFLSPRLEGLFHGIGDPALQSKNLRAIKTQVRPTMDRKKADELSYFFHILLRFRLEKDLIDGSLEVEDLPEAWTEGMQELIGIRPNSFAEGCIQDVHWFVGKFGYFPSYAVGHMMAAQILDAMRKDIPDIEQQILRGNFESIKEWLNENIHAKGRLLTWEKLLKEATGKKLDPDYLVEHLKGRYTA